MKVRAPGRICLFGEHQDYLGFPIIAAAIDRYIFIESEKQNHPFFNISMPNIGKEYNLPIYSGEDLKYYGRRDYIRSCYNILRRSGYIWGLDNGYEIKITGNIPINAGASSSSALVVGWLKMLSILGNNELEPEKNAELGYFAEVAEFGEAGGMMDHFASALGKIIYMETSPKFNPERIRTNIEYFQNSFILINSEEKKDTVDDLRKVKNRALDSFQNIREIYPKFDKYKTTIDEIIPYIDSLPKNLSNILLGNLENRDLTQEGYKILKNTENELLTETHKKEFGELIYKHHKNLSEKVGVSTKKIDNIVELCIENGAYGAKINGSGFGGTLFAYCPKNRNKLIDILKKEDITFYPVEIAHGAGVIL